ncbi:integrase core domain-containing protein [Thermopirellula anaerolimosa]
MARIFHPLIMLLARATQAEMAQMVDYLKTENRILRAKLPKRVEVTAAEREQLVKRGKSLGSKIKDLITIVSPRTFARWASGEIKSVGKKNETKGGRPRKPDEVRELVVKMAKENAWGLGRIMGELKKLGLNICKGTVRNILLENALDLGPTRGEGSWDEFIKMHAKTLWACDYFSKKVWTLGGLVEYFVLFFIQPGTRRVHIAGISANPDGAWMAQQARNLGMFFDDQPERAKYLVCDRDTKFTEQFRAILESEGVEVVQTAVRAPNQNAYAERFVQTIKTECFDLFIVLGEKHLRHLLTEFLAYYHSQRPHLGLGNLPPVLSQPPEPVGCLGPGDIIVHERLGGLLRHYERKAA